MKWITVLILAFNLACDYVSPVLFSMPGAQPSLQLVQMLYRHGDRTPVHPFPKDEHREHWLSLGLGQLTKIGKEQHYEFGQYIRQRYAGFLNDLYLWNEVVVNSTNVDRTLMSAASHLAGLYPPVGDEIWNDQIPWQPIPVHTTLLETDYLLNPDANCPKYNEIAQKVRQMPELQAIDKENEELFRYLSNHSGVSVKSILDITQVFDTLRIEKLYNLTLPKWVNDTVLNRLKNLADLSFAWNYITPEMQLLRGGPLLGHVINNINLKVNDSNSKIKLYMYSGHDTTVTAFMMNLNVFNNVTPPYTAAVFVELHKFDDGYFVQVLYRNSSREPMTLTIPGCANEMCPLKSFISLTKNKIPHDIVAQCHVKADCNETFPWTVTIIVICSTMALTSILLALAICWKKRQEQDIHYMMVNDE